MNDVKKQSFKGFIKGFVATLVITGGIVLVILFNGKKFYSSKQVNVKTPTQLESTNGDKNENVNESSSSLESNVSKPTESYVVTSSDNQTTKSNAISIGASYNNHVKTGTVAYEYLSKKQENNVDQELFDFSTGLAVSVDAPKYNVTGGVGFEKKIVNDNDTVFSYNVGAYASVDNNLNVHTAVKIGAGVENIKIGDNTTLDLDAFAQYENINSEESYLLGGGCHFEIGGNKNTLTSSNKTINYLNEFSETVNKNIITNSNNNIDTSSAKLEENTYEM